MFFFQVPVQIFLLIFPHFVFYISQTDVSEVLEVHDTLEPSAAL